MPRPQGGAFFRVNPRHPFTNRLNTRYSVHLPNRSFIFRLLFISALLLSCAGCVNSPAPEAGSSTDAVVAKSVHLATIPESVTASAAADHAASVNFVIHDKGKGFAYLEQKNAVSFIVHNGKAHNPFKETSHYVLSPDGKHIAYSYRAGKRRMVLDGNGIGRFFDDVWEPAFSPDSKHITYIGRMNDLSHVVIGERMSAGVPSFLGNPFFSADSQKVVYAESATESKKARLVVSDLQFNPLLTRVSNNKPPVANADRSRIAAAENVGGRERLIVVDLKNPDKVIEGPFYDAIDKIEFGSDGASVVYGAVRGKDQFLVCGGKEYRLPKDSEIMAIGCSGADKKASAAIVIKEKFYLFDSVNNGQLISKFNEYNTIAYSTDGTQCAYIAANGAKHVYVVVNGKEGPAYDMVVQPKFTPDGKKVVYRARKDGKRFVVVADLAGKVIRQHTAYEQVFAPVFTPDGKSVAYGVKDGNQLWWKVEKL